MVTTYNYTDYKFIVSGDSYLLVSIYINLFIPTKISSRKVEYLLSFEKNI